MNAELVGGPADGLVLELPTDEVPDVIEADRETRAGLLTPLMAAVLKVTGRSRRAHRWTLTGYRSGVAVYTYTGDRG